MNRTAMASSAIQKYDTYTFQSEPRAVRQNRPKYRDERGNRSVIGNLMNDPRVVRGNTFRRETLPTTAQTDPVQVQKQQEKRRVMQARARAKAKAKPRGVEPVAGRAHIEVQTELYLEELTDRVEESDMAVQTDPFLDRPPSPLFIPAKTGVDVETQIEDGDLFDFDMESKPILEVLVGKTVEQALMEVMEEEELDRLRDHQLEFEELRNAELIETQRLEEQARRRRDERERRMKQQAAVAKQERETVKKIAARSFAQSYLSGLVPSVFDNLDSNGYFYDTQEREIEEQFLPWLLDGIETRLGQQQQGRALLDDLIRQVVAARASRHGSAPVTAVVQTTEATAAVVVEEEQEQEQEQEQEKEKEQQQEQETTSVDNVNVELETTTTDETKPTESTEGTLDSSTNESADTPTTETPATDTTDNNNSTTNNDDNNNDNNNNDNGNDDDNNNNNTSDKLPDDTRPPEERSETDGADVVGSVEPVQEEMPTTTTTTTTTTTEDETTEETPSDAS